MSDKTRKPRAPKEVWVRGNHAIADIEDAPLKWLEKRDGGKFTRYVLPSPTTSDGEEERLREAAIWFCNHCSRETRSAFDGHAPMCSYASEQSVVMSRNEAIALCDALEAKDRALRNARDVVQESYDGAAEVMWIQDQARYKAVLVEIDAALSLSPAGEER